MIRMLADLTNRNPAGARRRNRPTKSRSQTERRSYDAAPKLTFAAQKGTKSDAALFVAALKLESSATVGVRVGSVE